MLTGKNNQYKIIGICVAGVHNDNVRDIVMSISKQAVNRGYKILLFNPFSDMYNENAYTRGEGSVFKLVNPDIIDTLVIYPESIKNDDVVNDIINDVRSADVPVISIDSELEGCYCMEFDYTDSFEQIVRHVVEDHGCQRVNFIAGIKGNEFSEERVDCYKKVLAENGIGFEEERLGYGDFWDVPAAKAMEGFLDSSLPLPEAVICANDVMAITACRVLRSRGYKVPDDVMVTGFDGCDLEKYVSPRLTTAGMDIEALGGSTVDIIDRLLSGETVPRKTVVSYSVRHSQSCGCKPMDAEAVGDKIVDLYHRMNHSYGHEVHMFSYLARTIDCRTIEDMGRLMVNYSDHFAWCCVNGDFLDPQKDKERYHQLFPSKMNVIMHCEGGKIVECPKEFSTCELLPELGLVLDNFNFLMFSPMHFQDEVIGYMVVSVNHDGFVFENTRRFITTTCQIFESFKNRKNLERVNAELADMHVRDPLTGIFNRRGFYKNAARLIRKCDRAGDAAVVLSIDLDGLKQINDTYGHIEGDKAIKAVSNALSKSCDDTAVCSRFGGDEFVAIIASRGDVNGVREKFLTSVNNNIRDYNSRSRSPYEVAISCGLSVMNECKPELLDDYIREADVEMYREKRVHHRGRIDDLIDDEDE